jgi:dihydroorotase-like cyclic amidohydrolase
MEKKRPKIAVRVKEVPEQTYDAEGNFVIHGLIDWHVHFREPGLAIK